MSNRYNRLSSKHISKKGRWFYVHRNKNNDKKDLETELEGKLAKKAIRGNADAYGELIRRNQEYLYKMAYIYTENQQDALDVASKPPSKEPFFFSASLRPASQKGQ